jgi:acetoin utilization deacetylase AcuC-like enzyme
VVIIDVDFHHGNGVVEILQRQSDSASGLDNNVAARPNAVFDTDWRQRCMYISLHAHPEYPYYTTHLPTPLSKAVTAEEYVSQLQLNLDAARSWCDENTLILVSLGLDTLSEDPIGGFVGLRSQNEYFNIGSEIGTFAEAVGAKTCFLLEGGYVVDRLGECVDGVFTGFTNVFESHRGRARGATPI